MIPAVNTPSFNVLPVPCILHLVTSGKIAYDRFGKTAIWNLETTALPLTVANIEFLCPTSTVVNPAPPIPRRCKRRLTYTVCVTYSVRMTANGRNRDNALPRAAHGQLHRTRILEGALALADRNGLEALSMRTIATQLGAKAMSLYNHVVNKDDIIDGIVDLVVSEMAVPDHNEDWKRAMRRRAASAHDVLLKHSWAILPLISRVNVGPAKLRNVDATLGCLHEAGFSYAQADYAWNAMDNHIYGFTLQEVNFPFEPSEYGEQAEHFLSGIHAENYPYFTELTRRVIDGRYSGVHDFNFGLDLILDGLEKYRGRTGGTIKRTP